jgi:uncharacterized membrane protein
MPELLTAAASQPGEPPAILRGRFFLIAALLVLTIGTALRVYHVGDRSLWFDEALTANISGGTLTQMLEETRSRSSAPIVHPLVLFLIEKAGRSSVAVRALSVLASLLALLLMLALVRVGISHTVALLTTAILAVSNSQIRYAQEVREYSFAVLLASILIFGLLAWEANGSRGRHPALLYAALFFAPLIQYGLLFLALGLLVTIALRLLLTRDTRFKLSHLVMASGFLAAGAGLSLMLTLRYQMHGTAWYLEDNYFNARTMSLPGFLSRNTRGLLDFFLPGHVTVQCFSIAAVIFCIALVRARKYDPIALLALSSVLVTACAAVVRLYPYGGVRQCLFLAPAVALFAGAVFSQLLLWLRGFLRPAATVGIVVLILFSGSRNVFRAWPYGEYEDIRSILKELARSSPPDDQVWVNHDAVPAVEFYLQGKDRRFVDGKYHKVPQEYVPELLRSVDPHSARVWLIFSHLQQQTDVAEEQLIVNTLQSGWEVRRVIAPTNAALYLASRKPPPVQATTGHKP